MEKESLISLEIDYRRKLEKILKGTKKNKYKNGQVFIK